MDHRVTNRQYSVAHYRAVQVLEHEKLSCDDVLYVLSALPVVKNTTRKSVIPENQSFVHSQAIGLTTQRGYYPSLSSVCLKCPVILKLLSRFALEYDPTFTFTTITLNYNYAAFPHRDVNHQDGKARIIALGDFVGGELQLHHDQQYADTLSTSLSSQPTTLQSTETISAIEHIIDIKNQWYDFDGRRLHSTNAFTGERYSLVYFTHLVWQHPTIHTVSLTLRDLGIPWPSTLIADENENENEDEQSSVVEPIVKSNEEEEEDEMMEDDRDCLIRLSKEDPSKVQENYVLLPNVFKNQQYIDFLSAEMISLLQLYFQTDVTNQIMSYYPVSSDATNATKKIEFLTNKFPIRIRYSRINDDDDDDDDDDATSDNKIQMIATRAVTFQCCRVLCEADSLEKLLLHGNRDKLPDHFNLDVLSFGKKVSTRQKRKILMQANLVAKPSEHRRDDDLKIKNKTQQSRQQQKKLCLLLDYDTSLMKSTSESEDGVIRRVYLCEYIEPKESIESIESLQKTNNNDDNAIDEDRDHAIKSSTPLKPLLSQLVCNLAKISTHSLVYDPFAGSGSLLNMASSFGGHCIGGDVRLFSSSSSSGYDFIQNNIYHQSNGDKTISESSYDGVKLDCIIADPPYGRREKHVDIFGCDEQQHESNEARALDRFKVISPLLSLASRTLASNGRLVFLFMNYPNSLTVCWNIDDLHIDEYPNLHIIHVCRESWLHHSTGHCIARDTIVIEKRL